MHTWVCTLTNDNVRKRVTVFIRPNEMTEMTLSTCVHCLLSTKQMTIPTTCFTENCTQRFLVSRQKMHEPHVSLLQKLLHSFNRKLHTDISSVKTPRMNHRLVHFKSCFMHSTENCAQRFLLVSRQHA
jgi:hypothetical protein